MCYQTFLKWHPAMKFFVSANIKCSDLKNKPISNPNCRLMLMVRHSFSLTVNISFKQDRYHMLIRFSHSFTVNYSKNCMNRLLLDVELTIRKHVLLINNNDNDNNNF